jgi:hypothetical protein
MQTSAKTRPEEEALWDKSQACQKLKFSLRTLDYRIADGSIPYIKFRGAVRFVPRDIEDFINSHRVGGAKPKIRGGAMT